jgi:hypothetical protein
VTGGGIWCRYRLGRAVVPPAAGRRVRPAAGPAGCTGRGVRAGAAEVAAATADRAACRPAFSALARLNGRAVSDRRLAPRDAAPAGATAVVVRTAGGATEVAGMSAVAAGPDRPGAAGTPGTAAVAESLPAGGRAARPDGAARRELPGVAARAAGLVPGVRAAFPAGAAGGADEAPGAGVLPGAVADGAAVGAGALELAGAVGLAGEVGLTGADGLAGAVGLSGVVDVAGAVGLAGVVGVAGAVGLAEAVGVGVAGAVGDAGEAGVAGADGVSDGAGALGDGEADGAADGLATGRPGMVEPGAAGRLGAALAAGAAAPSNWYRSYSDIRLMILAP